MDLMESVKGRMNGRSDLRFQPFEANGYGCCVLYLEGSIDLEMLQSQVFRPLQSRAKSMNKDSWRRSLFDDLNLVSTPYTVTDNEDDMIAAMLDGYVVLTVRGQGRAALLPLSKQSHRSITMPQNEKTIRGPQDSFVEDIWTNLSLIRQRIKTTDLNVDSFELGSESKTLVLLLYMKSKCEPRLVKEVGAKLNGIKVEGMFSSNMVEEYLDTNRFSPFPQTHYTERPDRAVTSLIEGKVVIMVNGTPNQLIMPASLVTFLQAAEDYYQRFFFSSWIRLVRYVFFTVSLILPSAYVAITTFHPEMIPISLLISIAASRDLVPFPAVFEAFAMELTFEVLREAGQRIPAAMGQTISIVGALVIGQAAVQAGIVSAPMVIVVSLTGISSFIIPQFELNLAVRMLRFSLLVLAGMFGLLGLLIGIILIVTHLIALEPFGVPYLSPLVPLDRMKLGDVLVRLPWPTMMKLKRKR